MHYFSHVLHLSFILSSIASCFITFMHFYGFFVPPWSSLIIFIFLGWSVLTFYILCQSWQKGGEIVEICSFFLKILYVRGRNTCLCKGGDVFHLARGSAYLLLRVHRSCDHVYIHCAYLWYFYDDVCLLHLPLHVLFLFYLYTHVSYSCMQSIISVSHKDALMSFVSSVSEVQVVKVYLP